MSKYIKLDDNALNNMTEFLKRHFSVSESDKLSCIECRSLAEKILSFLPTIDIVRCGECKYWKSEHICIGRWGWYGTMMTEADAFCSYGERIEE